MTWELWACVAAAVLVIIAIELGVLTRRAREIAPSEAFVRTAMWVVLTAALGVAMFYLYQARFDAAATPPPTTPPPAAVDGPLPDLDPAEIVGIAHGVVGGPIDAAVINGRTAILQFVTAYVIELALSADNIAVLVLLIAYFRLPRELVARSLFWAVLVSLLARLGLVLGGAELLRRASWVHYAFGGLLIIAMLRMLLMPDASTDFGRSALVRLVRGVFRIAPHTDAQQLTTRVDGHRALTPLAVVAIAAAVADITFALDSVPAVFAVTREPVIAFAASAMAVLALRSMYFALEPVIGRFRYLKVSLVFVLLYVAAKSFVIRETPIPTLVTLGVVAMVMGIGIGASVLYNRLHPPEVQRGALRPIDDLAELASWRNIRRGTILIIGAVIIVVGVAIIGPLPGPGGIPVVAAGLGLLATEFVWAQRMLRQFRDKTVELQKQTDKMAEKSNPWLVPLVVGAYWGVFWLATWLLGHWGYSKTAKFLWLASIGTFLPIAYWAFKTLYETFKPARRDPPPPAEH